MRFSRRALRGGLGLSLMPSLRSRTVLADEQERRFLVVFAEADGIMSYLCTSLNNPNIDMEMQSV